MRLPMSSSLHRILQNRSLSDHDMSSSSTYALELPYLGVMFLGKSPLNLRSFQKPLRQLYMSYSHEHSHDQRRMIISDSDILIFESDRGRKSKRTVIYFKFESMVNIQILKLSTSGNDIQNQHRQIAFLPVGCEQQERFRSLYSSINSSQYNLLSIRTSSHPTLLLFIIRKPGIIGSCSLLDCHVFAVNRESIAFELCDMIRKLIIKRTISPILLRKEALVGSHTKEHQPIAHQTMSNRENNDLISNVNLIDVVRSTTNTLHNPFSSSSLLINNVQHSSPFHDTCKVLTMNSDIHHMSLPCSTTKQRHFIKASSLIQDESDEIVNDLMNIVATEQLKTQASIKRHASFDQTSPSNDCTMNKKRYFQNKKRLLNPIATPQTTSLQPKIPPMLDGHLLRPHIVLNRYGDIGNYVPKFLRENITTRSSDSNENIFFRSTNGQIINGFLKLDFLSTKSINENHHHHQSSPCLRQDEHIFSLVQQLRQNPTKSFSNICPSDLPASNEILDIDINRTDDDHRVPHVQKSMDDVINDKKLHSFNFNQLSSKPKRVASFPNTETERPIDYRQYLRHTDQGVYLYGEEQRQKEQQITLEHSLGYLP